MKKKFLFSPLFIIVFIVLLGVGIAGAAVYFGGGGGTEEVNLQKGLVGWWKMDGNANDSTVNSNHGIVSGAILAPDHRGTANKAYYFDGINDSIDQNTYSSALDLTTTYTIALWFKSDASTDWSGLVSKAKAGTDGAIAIYRPTSNILRFHTYDGVGYATDDLSVNVWDNTWHFAVITVNNSVSQWYLDGSANGSPGDVSSRVPYSGAGTELWRIGKYQPANAYGRSTIDDVRIYNRALTATEVTALYESYNPGIVISDLQKGLVGWWKMDGNANDSTANSNHGTVIGAILTTDRKGQANKAYSFNGTSNYINVGNASSLSIANAITVSAWVYVNSLGATSWPAIVDRRVSEFEWELRLNGGNQVFEWRIGPDGYNATSAIITSQWVHVVGTYDKDAGSGNVKLYINGVLSGTPSTTSNALSYADSIYIGLGNTTQYLNGLIDDVRIYNRALSAAEIKALYDSYDPGIVISDLQKGLVGQWKMDGNALDATVNSNHGTVTGATLTIDRKGQVNKAYNFDGSDDHISAGNPTILNFAAGADFTVETWFNTPLSDDNERPMINKRASAGPGYEIHLRYGKVRAFIGNGSNWTADSPSNAPSYTVDTWNHAVVVFDRTNGVARFYLNGQAYGSSNTIDISSVTGTLVSSSNLLLGTYSVGAAATARFQGSLDDVRIYNRVLSATEVQALYESY